jgi:hypothetical protein
VRINYVSLVQSPALSSYEVVAIDNLYLVKHLRLIYVGVNDINDHSALTLTELRILVDIC